ncbi:Ribosome-releasing factor 2 mitochondrial, partial [Dissostichus eleginoides]
SCCDGKLYVGPALLSASWKNGDICPLRDTSVEILSHPAVFALLKPPVSSHWVLIAQGLGF